MRKKYIFGKKLYISVLTSILVLLTTVATTFAWVGVFANSTFEQFKINIKTSSLEEYGIEISSTGLPGTFSDSLDEYDIKRQILVNWGYDESYFLKENSDGKIVNDKRNIDVYYSALNLEQCTTLPTVSEGKLVSLGQFTTIQGIPTKRFYKFDIYLSAVQFYDGKSSSDFKMDAYLNSGMLVGTSRNMVLRHQMKFPESFVNPLSSTVLPENIMALTNTTLLNSARVDSKYASRVAFEKYEVVKKGKPELYSNTAQPKSSIIYSGDDYDFPVYFNDTSTYNFGGILDDTSNFSIIYLNATDYYYNKINMSQAIYNIRGVNSVTKDKLFNSKTNHLINSENTNEKIGVDEMMKITVYFWFEGWDADCFKVINGQSVTMNITFSLKNEEEF